MSQLVPPEEPAPVTPEAAACRQPNSPEQVEENTSQAGVWVARRGPETVVLRVTGSLDLINTPRLALLLKPYLTSEAATLVIDLSEVEFVGSPALRLLTHTHYRALHRGMSLRLVDGPPSVRRALRAAAEAGPTRFAIYPDVATAVDTPPSAARAWNLRSTGAGACPSVARQLKP